MKLTKEEQELIITISADDPDTCYIYCDYPKWNRTLKSIGAKLSKQEVNRGGKHWELPTVQLTLRKPKKPLSSAQKQALDRLHQKHSVAS